MHVLGSVHVLLNDIVAVSGPKGQNYNNYDNFSHVTNRSELKTGSGFYFLGVAQALHCAELTLEVPPTP